MRSISIFGSHCGVSKARKQTSKFNKQANKFKVAQFLSASQPELEESR
jgi:hypothetical protein